jgi:ubiquinone/menaquinone biosynthesis C-methylase UbiE
MGNYIDLLNKGGVTESKPIDVRMLATEEDRLAHWKLGEEYFDGSRAQGYGGYNYDGRWKKVAHDIFQRYNLKSDAKILDIGCAKGFLLKDIKDLYPSSEVWGLDISSYALTAAQSFGLNNLIQGNAASLPFEDKAFDFIFCNNSLHNILNINETIISLREISRVGKAAWISIAAYVSEEEKSRIDSWAVVATTYMSQDSWLRLFDVSGYKHDYYWFKP